MTAERQARFSASIAPVLVSLGAAGRILARPANLAALRKVLFLLLLLWIGTSLWRALLSFVPEARGVPELRIINPVTPALEVSSRAAVDVEALVAAQLFGEPGTALSVDDLDPGSGRSPAMSEGEAASTLAGIENGAPETRLPLLLRGVVASSAAGLGQAVIEHQKRQDLYRVGDELPLSGEVVLAKVLPDRVVLENSGRYELLRLFEESALDAQTDQLATATSLDPRRVADATANDNTGVQSADSDANRADASLESAAAIAAQYRDQLYADPESLADVVLISAVREGRELTGYRLAPGRASREFSALGFQAGDVVTAVNGLQLSDPSNTVRLYQAMRSAESASFDLLRNGESVTLNVDIGQLANGERE